jgi:hypothetical protein
VANLESYIKACGVFDAYGPGGNNQMTKEQIADQVLATVPKGWEFVRYGKGYRGETAVSGLGGSVFTVDPDESYNNYVIVKRKTRRVVTGGTWRSLGRPPVVGEWYYRESEREFYQRSEYATNDALYRDRIAVELTNTYEDVPEPTE